MEYCEPKVGDFVDLYYDDKIQYTSFYIVSVSNGVYTVKSPGSQIVPSKLEVTTISNSYKFKISEPVPLLNKMFCSDVGEMLWKAHFLSLDKYIQFESAFTTKKGCKVFEWVNRFKLGQHKSFKFYNPREYPDKKELLYCKFPTKAQVQKIGRLNKKILEIVYGKCY